MPHAIFIETNADGSGAVAAYAAELPGCAVFAATDEEAAAAMPARVRAFSAWLRDAGEEAPGDLGENWYEVERAAAEEADGERRRAAFSLDELSPSDAEFERWLGWLELAREELATAIDAAGEGVDLSLLAALAAQDERLAEALGGGRDGDTDGGAAAPAGAGADPVDRLYAARDRLTDALVAAGSSADGVRRAIRLAIADDLHVAGRLREAGS
jgi:hypothetical protein